MEIRTNELERRVPTSGDFDKSGEFGENDEVDEISLNIESRANELERRVLTKRDFGNPASFARITKLTIFRQRSRREPDLPDSSISPLCRYPSSKLIRSNLGLWQNIVKFAKFPLILLCKLLWRNFVKFTIFVIVRISGHTFGYLHILV